MSAPVINLFGIPRAALPKVLPSDALFGVSDFNGTLSNPIPLHAMLGDSRAALAARDCLAPRQVGNLRYRLLCHAHGRRCPHPEHAWPCLEHCLEPRRQNPLCARRKPQLHGAVVTWLKNKVHPIESPDELEGLIQEANQNDRSYFVPAFTGLGAPW